jgi:predicted kinase
MSANKITLAKPVLICLYGFPGSGKSYVARNLVDVVQMAHVSGDRIRSELFENPRYDAQENAIVTHLMKRSLRYKLFTHFPKTNLTRVSAE